jgi:uncharacterized integral membrane protein
MWRVLIALAVIVFGALFVIENSEYVPVGLVLGSPTKIRLIFLLLFSALIGFVFAWLLSFVREIKFRKEIRRLTLLNQAAIARLSGADEEQEALGKPR